MKLKHVLMITSLATAVVATIQAKAQEDTITVPPGRTVIEVKPGDTVIETAPEPSTTVAEPAPDSGTTIVAPGATIETETLIEPAGAESMFRYEEDDKDLFAGNELTFDLAGAYGVARRKFNDTFDTSLEHGDFGASAGLNYFITRHLGIGADAYGLDNDGTLVDGTSASLILRLPFARIAPYIFGGGGYRFQGPDSWTAHAGAGLEFRLNPHLGIFADGRHIFMEHENLADEALFRAGLRMAF